MAVFHLALRYLRSFKIFVRGVTHKHKATKAHKAAKKCVCVSLTLTLTCAAAGRCPPAEAEVFSVVE